MDTTEKAGQTMLDVLVVEGGVVQHRSIPDTLEAMRAVVGGDIELAGALAGDPDEPGGIALYVDEAGKLKGYAPTLAAPWLDDVLAGPVLVVAMDDEGEARDLTAQEIFVTSMALDGLLVDERGNLLYPPRPKGARGRHLYDGEEDHVHWSHFD